MVTRGVDIAIVGATGLLGGAVLDRLATVPFPLGRVHALASARSAGGTVDYRQRELPVTAAADFDYGQVQLVLLTADAATAVTEGARAISAGCLVVDASAAFRNDGAVPLVVPGFNDATLRGVERPSRVALPDAAVSQLLRVIAPLRAAVEPFQLDLTCLRAASGRGTAAVGELGRQTADVLNFRNWTPTVYSQQIAFNVIPVDADDAEGSEADAVRSLARLAPELEVRITDIDVPVFYGHGQVVRLGLKRSLPLAEIRARLAATPGLRLGGETPSQIATAVTDASGEAEIFLDRIQLDSGDPAQLRLWSVADNIRATGAHALVAVAEILVQEYL